MLNVSNIFHSSLVTFSTLTLTSAEVGMSIPVEFFPPFVEAAVEALEAGSQQSVQRTLRVVVYLYHWIGLREKWLELPY